MSLLAMEGFEGMGTTTGSGGASALQTKLGRLYIGKFSSQGGSDTGFFLTTNPLGGYALHTGDPAIFGGNQYVNFWLPSNQYANTLVVGMRFRMRNSGSGTQYPIISIYPENALVQGSASHLALDVCDYTYFKLRRGGSTILETSSAGLLTVDQWYHLEFQFKIGNGTSGAWCMKLDGDVILQSIGGGDTQDTTDEVSFIRIHGLPCNDATNHPYIIDDLHILNDQGSQNNTFLGTSTRIKIFYPKGDTTSFDFTPSTPGEHWPLVDEPDPTVVDYNQGITNGHKDLYDMENVIDDNVLGVMAEAIVQQATEGIRSMRHVVKSGVTTSNGTTTPIMDRNDLTVVRRILDADPNTSAYWLPANLNSAEFGVEVQT